ncbi:hypothetical protein M513_04443 [Trichuris suis]|uniref:Endonuclease/exonuclease/phosphatase domain-containing protein n=1 Tax=Trichuris suis TaxID=68888 RepID=A0A085MBZ7_9BILA|nr:hypothetical protein M513_04443 [Trichuris suis]
MGPLGVPNREGVPVGVSFDERGRMGPRSRQIETDWKGCNLAVDATVLREMLAILSLRNTSLHDRAKKQALVQQVQQVPFRIATLNVGTLTGRHREIAALLKRRRIDIACPQETKWKGETSRDIGDGYKLLYYGTQSGKNGVTVALAEHLREKITAIDRISDRLMAVRLDLDKFITRIVSAYAPQIGSPEEEKGKFWEDLEALISSIPEEEYLLLGADLNGHVGKMKDDAGACHGGHGYGARNQEGERIIDFVSAHDLVLANTYFIKKDNHLITFANGNQNTQIDYWVTRQRDLKLIKDCKVIPGERCLPRHRLLLLEIRMAAQRKRWLPTNTTKRIKWWKLKETPLAQTALQQALPQQLAQTPEEAWQQLMDSVHNTATQLLGRTKSGKKKINKEIWWWNTEVQRVINEKEQTYKQWQLTKTEASHKRYLEAKKLAKKEVSKAKAAHVKELYQELGTPQGELLVYKLAKARSRAAKDIDHYCQIKDKNGTILRKPKEILDRWKCHFSSIATKEFDHPSVSNGIELAGPVHEISTEEVKLALTKMKNGKATGADDLPSEFWKLSGPAGISWLTKLLNQVTAHKQISSAWKTSITIPIWKGKGDIADCSTYRPIRLTSHTLKILERIIDARLRDIIHITDN